MFKAKNKNKMRKDNQLYEIKIREFDKEKKRIKDTDQWRDYMVLYLTSNDFTLSSPSS